MTFRVILLSLFTLLLMFFSAMGDGVARVVFIVLWSIGLFAIFEVIRTYKRLQFHAGVLTIHQSLIAPDRFRSPKHNNGMKSIPTSIVCAEDT